MPAVARRQIGVVPISTDQGHLPLGPVTPFIVAVTTWTRWLGGLHTVALLPAFTNGSAALLGRLLQHWPLKQREEDGVFEK